MSDYKLQFEIKSWFPDWLGKILDTGTLFNKVYAKIKPLGWRLDNLIFKPKAYANGNDLIEMYITKEGSVTLAIVIGSIIAIIGFCVIKYKAISLASQQIALEQTQTVSNMENSILQNADLTAEQKTALVQTLYKTQSSTDTSTGLSLTEKIIIYGAVGLGALIVIMSLLGDSKSSNVLPAMAIAPVVPP